MTEARYLSGDLKRWQLALPLLFLLSVLLGSNLLERLDLGIYDALIRQYPLEPPPELALVAIDDQSLARLGQWPWPRTLHARLIKRLEAAGARVIVFDILFTEPARRAAEDRALARSIESHGRVILPLHLYPGTSRQPLSEFLPTAPLTRAAARLGHAHVELDSDGIARGLYLYEGLGEAVWPSLAVAAANLAGHRIPRDPPRQANPFVNVRQNKVRIPFAGLDGAIPTYSYEQVLAGRTPKEALQGKVVFVGATAAGFGDVLPSPLSGQAHPISGVAFHANVYSALTQQATITTAAPLTQWLAGAGLVLVIVWAFPWLRPGQTLALTGALLTTVLALTLGLFRFSYYWLPPGALLATILLAYPVWSARRLAVLNRFLSRQLDALGQEPGLALRAPERRAPLRLGGQLNELLRPAGWWLRYNRDILQGTPPPLPPLRQSGRWQHEGSISRIRIQRANGDYELGLHWSGSGPPAETLAYLERLPVQQPRLPGSERMPLERLERRIEQVRRATAALAEMRSFVGQGFERMPDGVIVTDALGVIQLVNEHVAEWLDQPKESLTGMPLTRLLAVTGDEAQWREEMLWVLQRGENRSLQRQYLGRELLIHLAPFELSEAGRSGLIANLVDISELQERQRQYREAVDFISHDVRSPLVSQLALIEQLKRSGRGADSQSLDKIARLARRSFQLAEDFIQLARAEQLSETRFYDCELLDIVENARDSLRDQAMAKDIRLTLKGEEGIWLQGNAELLERAVTNLVANAIQYSPRGSRVRLEVRAEPDRALISVADQGPGIAPEDQARLFERFHRHRQHEEAGTQGAGLGLAFVELVTRKHGGLVTVESEPGKGARFILQIPLEPDLPGTF